MVMAPAKQPATACQAEVVLLPQLKSCLVNLPSSLVAVLLNANTVAQNVVVELNYSSPSLADKNATNTSTTASKSIYLGWTGMQSQSKLTPIVGRDGIQGTRGRRQEQDIATVELDSTLGRMLGITDGTKVAVTLHLDPPLAHTVNIEPLTPTDWDIIELHARFLEMNFLSQVRALPNPSSTEASRSHHPLTLHLTPTSTANILVTGLDPPPGASHPFVKIAPDAEVIVAPKSRHSSSTRNGARDSRSVASTSRRSVGARSTASTARHRSTREDEASRPPVFLRALDRSVASEWFDEEDKHSEDIGLRVWVDRQVLLSKNLKGVTWATVSVIQPAGLQEPQAPQTQTPEQDKVTEKVVARLFPWDDAPDSQHAALSSRLCASLASVGIIGGIVRIEAAPMQLPKTSSIMKQSTETSKDAIVKTIRIAPFLSATSNQADAISFGAETKAEQEKAIQKIRSLFGGSDSERSLLHGPLTNNMILPAEAGQENGDRWPGGILRFEPAPQSATEVERKSPQWLLGGDRKLAIEVAPAVPRPAQLSRQPPGENVPSTIPDLVGIDSLLHQLRTNILHSSSVLLTGGLGSGKTSVVQHLMHSLRQDSLYHTIYFPCRTLITDETRVSTIKETLQRLFGTAAWGARSGGKSLIVLDDLDKLCPVETELQVGGENGRNKQVSELLCSIVKRFCSRDSDVVLVATAQSKESVHNVIIGGHVVRETVSLKAPDKDGRRRILEHLVRQSKKSSQINGTQNHDNHAMETEGHPWMDGSESERPVSRDSELGFEVDESIDFLDLAGQTDGYMAGDLKLMVSRARSEALIRAVTENSDDIAAPVSLSGADFAAALKGFTPASLRNVNLQSSTTTFSSIGGLHETRQTLLETLQYPTTYAPIFAKCPLRLRSGLLLYGYPGCGKTMLASAVAGECGLNFISVKGPEILNKYIGASEKSVRDLFERAQAARPCVLFFDEFDSIAPKRGHDSTGVTDRVVNQLLTQMDGAEGLSGVYVLAATSRPDLIDPALLRPGRLDKSLLCDMPRHSDRLDILKAVSSKLRLESSLLDTTPDSDSQSMSEIARRTEGYSGADLQAVMYNAHLEAIHDLLGPSDANGNYDTNSKDDSSTTQNTSARYKDFTFFRIGDNDDPSNGISNGDETMTSNKNLAERAAISKKLADMEQARKRARLARHAAAQEQSHHSSHARSSHARHDDQQSEHQQTEPVIAWKHVLKSLAETRPSLSLDERNRLNRVYGQFVTGREGGLPDGQAGTEIGGRSTLM